MMRGLGIALIIIGVLGAVLIFVYPVILNWSGLIGCLAAILSGVGFYLCGPHGTRGGY